MRKTITVVRCAGRAWMSVMRYRGQLSEDRYQNPRQGYTVDTAFIARWFAEFAEQLTKEA